MRSCMRARQSDEDPLFGPPLLSSGVCGEQPYTIYFRRGAAGAARRSSRAARTSRMGARRRLPGRADRETRMHPVCGWGWLISTTVPVFPGCQFFGQKFLAPSQVKSTKISSYGTIVGESHIEGGNGMEKYAMCGICRFFLK